MACKHQLFGIEDVGEKEEQGTVTQRSRGQLWRAALGLGWWAGVHPHSQAGSGDWAGLAASGAVPGCLLAGWVQWE